MSRGSQDRFERMRENFQKQGGRRQRQQIPTQEAETVPPGGPGKRADEKIISVAVDEILPDRYQGRLRWPVELEEIQRLYSGEWDAQDFLDYLSPRVRAEENPALEAAWFQTANLARSILTEGQVAPITVAPARDLPVGYRFVIETGEGRYWAYQMMRWLLNNAPEELDVPPEAWHEDPAFIRAVAVTAPSRLRQVAENEQRQSYPSAIDRAIAYASMLAEEASYPIEGQLPGIHEGVLELPDAYWRAAKRGLRGRKVILQQVPAGARQIQRHLKLLTDLDPQVLAQAKQHGLSEAQLRPLVGKSPDEQRGMVEVIVQEGLSSRQVAAVREKLEADVTLSEQEALSELADRTDGAERDQQPQQPTLPEEVARLLRALTTATSRYEKLRGQINDNQIAALLEAELRSYDESARGVRRSRTPRKRIQRLLALLQKLEV